MSNRPLHQRPQPEPADGEPCAVIPLHARRGHPARQVDADRHTCEEFATYLGRRLADGRVAACDLEVAFGVRLRRVPIEHAMAALGYPLDDASPLEILDEIVDVIESAWSGGDRYAASNGPTSQAREVLRLLHRVTM